MLGGNALVCSALDNDANNDDEGFLTEGDFKALMRDVAVNLESRSTPARDKASSGKDAAWDFALSTFDM